MARGQPERSARAVEAKGTHQADGDEEEHVRVDDRVLEVGRPGPILDVARRLGEEAGERKTRVSDDGTQRRGREQEAGTHKVLMLMSASLTSWASSKKARKPRIGMTVSQYTFCWT